jgi:protein gp37
VPEAHGVSADPAAWSARDREEGDDFVSKSNIEWTDETWNPVTGCTEVSPGCDKCYARTLINTRQVVNPKSARFGHPFAEVMLHPERLSYPFRWSKPRLVFVNSLSDLFHRDVPNEYIRKVFQTMGEVERHTFQVLTKRAERMRRFMRTLEIERCDPASVVARNVWLGTSVESNDYAWRADMLRETPAAVRFLSVEPMLGPIDKVNLDGIDWVIVGGESGPGFRPMQIDWTRDVRDRCVAAGIPFFFKQWHKKGTGRELDGRTWDEMPMALRGTECRRIVRGARKWVEA